MRKEEIAEILADWNFWGKELNSGIKRDEYTDKAISFLKTSMIVTITGIRRAGKSFILRQIARSLIDKGVEPKDT